VACEPEGIEPGHEASAEAAERRAPLDLLEDRVAVHAAREEPGGDPWASSAVSAEGVIPTTVTAARSRSQSSGA